MSCTDDSLPWFSILLIFIGISDEAHAIYSGTAAAEGDFTYLVSIGTDQHICGGAILDDYHILTAAHCVDCIQAQDLLVMAGMTDLTSTFHLTRRVESINIHDDYRRASQECLMCFAFSLRCLFGSFWEHFQRKNDIAVLTLTEPLPLQGPITSADLPSDASLPVCSLVRLAGWGITEHGVTWSLRFLEMQILTPEQALAVNPPCRANEFDAFDPYLKGFPSYGDSGSPLVEDNIVYGITSSGVCMPGAITTFTKVYDHLDFIKNATRNVLQMQ